MFSQLAPTSSSPLTPLQMEMPRRRSDRETNRKWGESRRRRQSALSRGDTSPLSAVEEETARRAPMRSCLRSLTSSTSHCLHRRRRHNTAEPASRSPFEPQLKGGVLRTSPLVGARFAVSSTPPSAGAPPPQRPRLQCRSTGRGRRVVVEEDLNSAPRRRSDRETNRKWGESRRRRQSALSRGDTSPLSAVEEETAKRAPMRSRLPVLTSSKSSASRSSLL
jgi:hypothetical protein